MTVIVITGSTRGIGYALADAFLARGCQVVISGRTRSAVQDAAHSLGQKHSEQQVLGCPCDVTSLDQVQALWSTSVQRFGLVDIWINNAGQGHAQQPFWTHPEPQLRQMVDTNVLGAMYGGRTALKEMLKQDFGQIFNMEGLGSDGRWVEGLTLYGSTKASLRYLTDSWAREVDGTGVLVGGLYPGMVLTDFLTSRFSDKPEELERAKRVFNILADLPETVAPWLVERMLGNKRNGVRFKWLSGTRVMLRFMLAPFRSRDLFKSSGEKGPL